MRHTDATCRYYVWDRAAADAGDLPPCGCTEAVPGSRVCSWCHTRKPESDFHPDGRGTFWCRVCVEQRAARSPLRDRQAGRGSQGSSTPTDKAVNRRARERLATTGVRRGSWIEVTAGRHRGERHRVVALNPTEAEVQVPTGRWFSAWRDPVAFKVVDGPA